MKVASHCIIDEPGLFVLGLVLGLVAEHHIGIPSSFNLSTSPRSRPQSRGFFRLMIVVLILGLGYSAHAFLTGSNVDANKDKSML